jgi:DNA-binding SARP family transcriptional activator
VLQAWARALQVLAGVCDDVPDAEDEAMAAADFAARAGVPGARIAATVAVARLDPIRRARLLDGALAEARTIGLPDNVLAGWGAAPAPTPASTVDRVPPVWICCFGGFRMEVDGRPVQLSTVRARARSALRLLAMQTGQVVHREILIEALWPDLPPPAATRNLQVSISALRGLLEPESVRGKAHLLIRSGDAYGIALPPGGYADTTAFTEAVQRWKRIRRAGCSADGELQAMREALAAYGGELLPEDGPADWAVPAREHFRLQATQVARALAVAEIDGGNRSDAIATAEFCLTLDPHDDEAWRVLVRAYSDGGAPAKAVEVRRRYAEMLASLGLPAATPAYRAVSPVRTLPAQQSLPAGRAVGRRRT